MGIRSGRIPEKYRPYHWMLCGVVAIVMGIVLFYGQYQTLEYDRTLAENGETSEMIVVGGWLAADGKTRFLQVRHAHETDSSVGYVQIVDEAWGRFSLGDQVEVAYYADEPTYLVLADGTPRIRVRVGIGTMIPMSFGMLLIALAVFRLRRPKGGVNRRLLKAS